MAIVYEDFLNVIGMAEDKGRYILGLCPFHDDAKPSLLVFEDGWWRCLGCNRNGKWITLWNKSKGQPVSVTPERRTNWRVPVREGEDIEEVCYIGHNDLISFETLQWYIQMRGLENRIEPCEIGYRNGWYSFPVRDHMGDFQTAVFRAAPHIQDVTGMRYWCAHKPTLYVPDWSLFESKDYIAVVYGIFDALALSDLRIPVCTSSSGNLTFQADWLDGVRKHVYVIPDRGEEAVAQDLANRLGWRGKVLRLSFPEGKKDPAGFFEAGKQSLLQSQLSNL